MPMTKKRLCDAFKYILKEIISINTEGRKQFFKFMQNTWKYWLNETDDEI